MKMKVSINSILPIITHIAFSFHHSSGKRIWEGSGSSEELPRLHILIVFKSFFAVQASSPTNRFPLLLGSVTNFPKSIFLLIIETLLYNCLFLSSMYFMVFI